MRRSGTGRRRREQCRSTVRIYYWSHIATNITFHLIWYIGIATAQLYCDGYFVMNEVSHSLIFIIVGVVLIMSLWVNKIAFFLSFRSYRETLQAN